MRGVFAKSIKTNLQKTTEKGSRVCRPYLWECNTAFMYLNALESIALLILTIVVLLRTRITGMKSLFAMPYLVGGLLFCLTFSFAIGITAYNFGALVRFKIPVLGVFLFILLYVTTQTRKKQMENIE